MKRALRTAALVCTLAVGAQTQMLRAQEGEEAHEEEHGFDNAFALFVGGSTHLQEHGSTGFTLGVEYARRVSSWLKVGVLWEYIASEHEREYILLVPFFAHVAGGLVFVAGPGLEQGEHDTEGGATTESEAKFLGRLGAIYEIEVNHFAIGPQINADVSGGRWTLVYGVTFGIGF